MQTFIRWSGSSITPSPWADMGLLRPACAQERIRPIHRTWPALDVVEYDRHIEVEVDVPGFAAEELSVTFEDGLLRVAGDRELERGEDESRAQVLERYRGNFERLVRVRHKIDPEGLKATLVNGVLRIELSKAEVAHPRRIPIEV